MFIALTETWPRYHKDAEVAIEGYNLYRQDRNRSRSTKRGRDSGGVAIYVSDIVDGPVEQIINFSNGVIEIIGLYIKARDLIVINVYRQPDNPGEHRSSSIPFNQALSELKMPWRNTYHPLQMLVYVETSIYPMPHGKMEKLSLDPKMNKLW